MKSRATWLECGDNNTNFFHAYAIGRKAANTVWSLENEHGHVHDTFDGMASMGVEHFKNLYKVPTHATLVEVIRIAHVFPGFVDAEDNQALMEEVTEGELKRVLQSF